MLDQRCINKYSFRKKKIRTKFKIICAIFNPGYTFGHKPNNILTSPILCIKISIRKLFDELNFNTLSV